MQSGPADLWSPCPDRQTISSQIHFKCVPLDPKARFWFLHSCYHLRGVGTPEGPDAPLCGVSSEWSEASNAGKNTHHRPSTWRKEGSGSWPSEAGTGALGNWDPQEVSNRVGRSPVSPLPALAMSAQPSGRITWQGRGQIKQEYDLNNFQGRLLQMPGPPCCVWNPGPAKNIFLYKGARKGVTFYPADSSRPHPVSCGQRHPSLCAQPLPEAGGTRPT